MKRALLAQCSILGILLAALACGKRDEPQPNPAAAKPSASPTAEGPVGVLAPKEQLRTIAAPPEGDVAAQVKDAREREAKEGRKLLVYIGATWCQPCQRFHAAAAHGDLDKAFPDLTLLEFDADRDGERLVTANYNTRLIPYFGVPAPDGRGTGRHIEGSVKGDAVADISPRLRNLLAGR